MLPTKNAKNTKKKYKKLPSKWLPGRKHLILAETGVAAILVSPAWFYFSPFHPYKYGALIASIPSWSSVHVDSSVDSTSIPMIKSESLFSANQQTQMNKHAYFKRASQNSIISTNHNPSSSNQKLVLLVRCHATTWQRSSSPRWLPRCQYMACRICTQSGQTSKNKSRPKKIYMSADKI